MSDYQEIPQEQYQAEEEEINLLPIIRTMLKSWKTIVIAVGIGLVLGLLAALTMKREYTVTAVMVPQLSSSSSRAASLGSLAALAGFSLNATPTAELSPLIYPQIVSSVPFRKELLYTPLHFSKVDTLINIFDYYQEYEKPSVMSVVAKYTVGLPGLILGSLRKEEPDIQSPAGGEVDPKALSPVFVSKDEEKFLKFIGENVSLDVDKKEGYLTLRVTGLERLETAELAIKAQTLLEQEVTRFRTDKAQDELDYIQARYNEVKAEAESLQYSLARVSDRANNMMTSQSRIEMERLQSKYNVANSVYMEMAKQLESAKMAVKKDTPTFSIIQPVSVPVKPSNSRMKTIIVWIFLGGVVGVGIVLVKMYLPRFKKKWEESEEEMEELEKLEEQEKKDRKNKKKSRKKKDDDEDEDDD